MRVLVSFSEPTSPCSETLTSNRGVVYVTVTSLILCCAARGHFRTMEMLEGTAVIHGVKKIVSSPNAHKYDYTHTHRRHHPCSPTHQPLLLLCGKLLLITTQSASLVHIAFQECLKHTVPHIVKPTGSVCSLQLTI